MPGVGEGLWAGAPLGLRLLCDVQLTHFHFAVSSDFEWLLTFHIPRAWWTEGPGWGGRAVGQPDK